MTTSRYILEGSGYFDVRAQDEKWIRISMGKGDMITLPAGMYHRFTLDDKNYIKVGQPRSFPFTVPPVALASFCLLLKFVKLFNALIGMLESRSGITTMPHISRYGRVKCHSALLRTEPPRFPGGCLTSGVFRFKSQISNAPVFIKYFSELQ